MRHYVSLAHDGVTRDWDLQLRFRDAYETDYRFPNQTHYNIDITHDLNVWNGVTVQTLPEKSAG